MELDIISLFTGLSILTWYLYLQSLYLPRFISKMRGYAKIYFN